MAGQIAGLVRKKNMCRKSWKTYTGAAKVIKGRSARWADETSKNVERVRIVLKRAFLFAGQGAQKLGMAAIYATYPVVKEAFDT